MEDSAGRDGVSIFTPIDLPCGRSLNNRLVKVAMYEHLADFLGGPPNQYHDLLYSKWAESCWGMVITGNVQVSESHLALGRDMVSPKELSERCFEPFKRLAASIKGSGETKPLAIMQLSHAGRQSSNFIGGRFPFQPPLAPSSIRVAAKDSGWLANAIQALAFQRPVEMSVDNIDNVVEAFVRGARAAFESGFDGIQLHCAHGYLLAQFMSTKSNHRTDEYSANPPNALRLLQRIVSGIRSSTSKAFVIGIKLNAADYARENKEGFDRVLDHFRAIAQWGKVDFIEVSGGDYENPAFMTRVTSRQALFSDFSKTAMDALESLSLGASSPLILLTGGLRTPELLHIALTSRQSHLLGIGRGSVLCPNLPRLPKQQRLFGTLDLDDPRWSAPFCPEPDLNAWPRLRSFLPTIPLVGAGISMAWYIVTIRRLAIRQPSTGHFKEKSTRPDYTLGPFGAIFWMWVWVDTPCGQSILQVSLAVSLCAIAVLALIP